MASTSIEAMSEEELAQLKSNASELVAQLEQGNLEQAQTLIESLQRETITTELQNKLRSLLSGVHKTVAELNINPQEATANFTEADSALVSARERLSYVMQLTQQAADQTMDVIDQGLPVANTLLESSEALKADWDKLRRREMKVDEFNALSKRLDAFLQDTYQQALEIQDNYNKILMNQEFQDLTGQVIQKVMALMQSVEARLVDLVGDAASVEQATGVKPEHQAVSNASAAPEGPQIKADQRDDVASGQEDVDDLLSSLGI